MAMRQDKTLGLATSRENQEALRVLSIYRVGYRISAMFEGVVKWYDAKKKYGYLTITEKTPGPGALGLPIVGLDVFIHASNILDANKNLNPQEVVKFDFIARQAKGWQAFDVSRTRNDPHLPQRAPPLCDNPEFLDPELG